MKKFLFLMIFLSFISIAHAGNKTSCLDFHVITNAPMGYKNDDGKALGVHWEYLSVLEKNTGFCINKKLLPYARIWQSIAYGHHDGGIVFKSAERTKLVEYVALIRTVKTIVIPVNGVAINNYHDLKNITIGKTRGTHLSRKFDNDKDLNVIELNNYAQVIEMLKHGRIDAIAGSALVLSYQLNKYLALDHIDISNKFILGEKEQWLQFSMKSKHLHKIPTLKQAIMQLQQNGTFKQIMDKYYGESWQQINK